jgi:lipopolysaccharide/colanic/teichoic acid biosynthesis glycosyltransferase
MRKINHAFKRGFDVSASLAGLLIFSPLLTLFALLIWFQDFKSPFYISNRVGKNEKIFKIIKLRSMIINADKTGVDSTSLNDERITRIGHFIRSYKLDELSQLWNVLKGDMSLVGPRPNVKRETDMYTPAEKELLSVKPGITDFASIVFADEGEILSNAKNPDISYNQLIRPGKSQLGLFYISHQSFLLDIVILALTAITLFSRTKSLVLLTYTLKKLGANKDLIAIASRKKPLVPMPPPGATKIVTTRDM